MSNFFTPKDIIEVWKDMGKGTKIFFIGLLVIVFVTMGIVFNLEGNENLKEESQTETCRMALEYLMNTYEVQEKYGSDELPELRGVHRKDYVDGIPYQIKYLFVFHPLPFSNIGDQYTVELRYEKGEYGVVGVKQGTHMS